MTRPPPDPDPARDIRWHQRDPYDFEQNDTRRWRDGEGLLGWALFYQLAVAAHRDVGSIFRALVDVSIGPFFEWVDELQLPPDANRIARASAAAEYLRSGTPMRKGDGTAD